jgi:Fe-S cluster assembly protein SufD
MNDTQTDIQIPDISPELERGPQWLRDLRHASQQAYNATPLPRRGLHLWRYTDPFKFTVDRESVADTAFGENFDAVEKNEIKNLQDGHLSGLVTDLGGREISIRLSDSLTNAGVVVTSLSQAVTDHTDLVETYLYKLVNRDTGKFESMNGALWNDGVFIYVPDGKQIDQPIHLLREAGLAKSAQFPRLLVIVGKNAHLTIIDEYGGGSSDEKDGTSYSNGAVEIFGLTDSRTRYVMLQRQSSATTSYLTHRASIAQGATMLTIPLSFGGSMAKQNFGVRMEGPGAESHMFGLLFGSEYQHFDNHTLHDHRAVQTYSNIDFKVVLRDKATSAYTGLIKIENHAKGCQAYQENRNLLLNKGTKAETIPELEILNEDVSCSHGATIGPIDPMQVFYLESRGIHHEEAVRMVVSGFVANTLKQVPDDLRERISGFVEQRLEGI